MAVINNLHCVSSQLSNSNARARARISAGTGFTLLELMIVLAVVAILAVLAAPTFNASMKRANLDTARNTLSGSLTLARSEALARKVRTVVCAGSFDTGCGGSGDWSQGWIVFADADADGRFSGGGDVLLHTQSAYKNINIAMSGASQVIYEFTGTLVNRVQRAVKICPADQNANISGRHMIIASTGAVRHESNKGC